MDGFDNRREQQIREIAECYFIELDPNDRDAALQYLIEEVTYAHMFAFEFDD